MKIPLNVLRLTGAACCMLAVAAARGQILQDDFNGVVIDPSSWQILLPFADSSVTASNGFAVLQNRGKLLTVTNLPQAIDVRGRFAFAGNPHDSFWIISRTDGQSTAPYGVFDHGIACACWIQNDLGETTANLLISRFSTSIPQISLASGTFPLTSNVFYDFRVTDDGKHVAFYLGDLATPRIEGFDTNVFGQKLGFFNREGAGGGTTIAAGSIVWLDSMTVNPFIRPPSLRIRVQQVEICWDAQATNTYQVQYRSSLTTNAWLNLGSPVQTNSGSICILDPVPQGEPQRLYRLNVLP